MAAKDAICYSEPIDMFTGQTYPRTVMAMDSVPRTSTRARGRVARDEAGAGNLPMPTEALEVLPADYQSACDFLGDKLEPEDLFTFRALLENLTNDDFKMQNNAPAMDSAIASTTFRDLPLEIRQQYAFDAARYAADLPRLRREHRMLEQARARHSGGFAAGQAVAQDEAKTAREVMFPNGGRLIR